jgi:hypothetical protein
MVDGTVGTNEVRAALAWLVALGAGVALSCSPGCSPPRSEVYRCEPPCPTGATCGPAGCTFATPLDLGGASPAPDLAGCSPACGGAAPYCTAGSQCVPCLVDEHCPAGELCQPLGASTVCTPGCRDDARCGGPTLRCCAGQCVDSASDAAHCGACGTTCLGPRRAGACAAGVCGLGACQPGWGDCNADPSDGCETNLGIDGAHCGACGSPCALPRAVAGCAGACFIAACHFGWDDCDGAPDNGCEQSVLEDLQNCGACGHSCARPAHGQVACRSAACALASCDAGFGDCDGLLANGCETPLVADGKNCGECGVVCAMGLVCKAGQCTCPRCTFPNASSKCVGNQCVLDRCVAGFANCDGNAANGCEAAVAADPRNCGGCGIVCDLGNLCEGGACLSVLISDTSWKQLVNNPPAGWEQPAFDDSLWALAVDEGVYGTAPWNRPLQPFDQIKSQAHWIWYYKSNNAADNDTVYFRHSFAFSIPNVTLTITADDSYTVWLDGVQVAQSLDLWWTVHTFPLQLTPNHAYVMAVKAKNNGGPGGLLLDLR